jgi:hypothetical protein
MRRIGVVIAAVVLIGAAPQPGAAKEPRARAWAMRIALATPVGEVIDLADASAESGAVPLGTGFPVSVGGDIPVSATADLGRQDDKQVFHSYDDPTGSLSLEGGFAEAHVTQSATSASAGFATMAGSGFAMANELFTFEQQEELLGQWQDVMDGIFGPLNEQLDILAGPLGGLGLTLPRLEGISPAGLVDVGKARQVASSASTSSSPGFSSARADTTIADVKLFGGFIELHDVGAEAISESVAGDDTREATARIGSMSIAGIDVAADDEGFRVAGNQVLPRSVLQPALDLLLDGLAATGLRITVVDDAADGDLHEASALEVSLASPQGAMFISIAHAEASAASVGAPAEAVPPVTPHQDGEPPTQVLGRGPLPGGVVEPEDLGSTPPGEAAPRAAGPVFRRPGVAEARAMRTVYLLFIVAGVAGSIMIPSSIRRSRRRIVSLLKGAFR